MVVKHNFHGRSVSTFLISIYAIAYSTSFDVFTYSFYLWKTLGKLLALKNDLFSQMKLLISKQ